MKGNEILEDVFFKSQFANTDEKKFQSNNTKYGEDQSKASTNFGI